MTFFESFSPPILDLILNNNNNPIELWRLSSDDSKHVEKYKAVSKF